MSFARNLKRAARHNPAWHPARIYTMATDATGGLLPMPLGPSSLIWLRIHLGIWIE